MRQTETRLYHVDKFDTNYWIQAENIFEAMDIAEAICGHDDVNECLEWHDTLWGSKISNLEEALSILHRQGVQIYS
jgi:hypothetical protein